MATMYNLGKSLFNYSHQRFYSTFRVAQNRIAFPSMIVSYLINFPHSNNCQQALFDFSHEIHACVRYLHYVWSIVRKI